MSNRRKTRADAPAPRAQVARPEWSETERAGLVAKVGLIQDVRELETLVESLTKAMSGEQRGAASLLIRLGSDACAGAAGRPPSHSAPALAAGLLRGNRAAALLVLHTAKA
jgi:hypothetical protein